MRDSLSANNLALGIAIGLMFGASFGILTDNLAVGFAIGLPLGVGIGAALDAANRSSPGNEGAQQESDKVTGAGNDQESSDDELRS